MEATLIHGLVFSVLLAGSCLAQSNDTVTYTADDKDSVEVEVKSNLTTVKSLTTVKCYDCSYYKRGTNQEGNKDCHMADPLAPIPEGMKESTCAGYCVKEWMQQLSYLYVGRYCAEECEEGTELRFGHTLVRTCCTDDLCNSASSITASLLPALFLYMLGKLV